MNENEIYNDLLEQMITYLKFIENEYIFDKENFQPSITNDDELMPSNIGEDLTKIGEQLAVEINNSKLGIEINNIAKQLESFKRSVNGISNEKYSKDLRDAIDTALGESDIKLAANHLNTIKEKAECLGTYNTDRSGGNEAEVDEHERLSKLTNDVIKCFERINEVETDISKSLNELKNSKNNIEEEQKSLLSSLSEIFNKIIEWISELINGKSVDAILQETNRVIQENDTVEKWTEKVNSGKSNSQSQSRVR